MKKELNSAIAGLLTQLSSAVSDGKISTREAKKMRAQFGITQAYFTRKQPNRAVAAAKRKAAKKARMVTLKRGTKGEKRSGGYGK
jgi:hypothetical protein